MTWAVDIVTIFKSFLDWFSEIWHLLDSIMLAPYVSLLTVLICGLFIGLTISMFVRSGKT